MKRSLRWAGLGWVYGLLLLQAWQRLQPQLWLEPIWVWSVVYALIPAVFAAGFSFAIKPYLRAEYALWDYLLGINGFILLCVSWINLGTQMTQ